MGKTEPNSKRNRYLLKRFGITEDQYNDLLREQQSACAICQAPASQFKTKLAVDHDHVSRHVRGLLCFRCNKFRVGRNRKGIDTDILRRVIEYLEAEYRNWIVPPKVKKRKRRGLKLQKQKR